MPFYGSRSHLYNTEHMKTFYEITARNFGWGWGYGFFSNYRVCLEQLILHYERNDKRIPYINWGGTTWVESFSPSDPYPVMTDENPFDFWYDQEIPQLTDEVIVCPNKVADTIDHASDYFSDTTQLKRQQYVDRLYLKPKKHILDAVDNIYEKELRGHTVLGIMARGSEYNNVHPQYGIFGIDDYIAGISKILDKNTDIDKLFIVSEETEFVEKLHKAFPSSYFVPDVFRRTDETFEYIVTVHFWCNISRKRENHCRLLGEEVILQTKLLGKCDYLFGRFSGVLAGAVLWGDNIKKVYQL